MLTAGVAIEFVIESSAEDSAMSWAECEEVMVITVPSAMTWVMGAEEGELLPSGAMHTAWKIGARPTRNATITTASNAGDFT
jgi:hypothetical protein